MLTVFYSSFFPCAPFVPARVPQPRSNCDTYFRCGSDLQLICVLLFFPPLYRRSSSPPPPSAIFPFLTRTSGCFDLNRGQFSLLSNFLVVYNGRELFQAPARLLWPPFSALPLHLFSPLPSPLFHLSSISFRTIASVFLIIFHRLHAGLPAPIRSVSSALRFSFSDLSLSPRVVFLIVPPFQSSPSVVVLR